MNKVKSIASCYSNENPPNFSPSLRITLKSPPTIYGISLMAILWNFSHSSSLSRALHLKQTTDIRLGLLLYENLIVTSWIESKRIIVSHFSLQKYHILPDELAEVWEKSSLLLCSPIWDGFWKGSVNAMKE